jgi:hypothetical protein
LACNLTTITFPSSSCEMRSASAKKVLMCLPSGSIHNGKVEL